MTNDRWLGNGASAHLLLRIDALGLVSEDITAHEAVLQFSLQASARAATASGRLTRGVSNPLGTCWQGARSRSRCNGKRGPHGRCATTKLPSLSCAQDTPCCERRRAAGGGATFSTQRATSTLKMPEEFLDVASHVDLRVQSKRLFEAHLGFNSGCRQCRNVHTLEWALLHGRVRDGIVRVTTARRESSLLRPRRDWLATAVEDLPSARFAAPENGDRLATAAVVLVWRGLLHIRKGHV